MEQIRPGDLVTLLYKGKKHECIILVPDVVFTTHHVAGYNGSRMIVLSKETIAKNCLLENIMQAAAIPYIPKYFSEILEDYKSMGYMAYGLYDVTIPEQTPKRFRKHKDFSLLDNIEIGVNKNLISRGIDIRFRGKVYSTKICEANIFALKDFWVSNTYVTKVPKLYLIGTDILLPHENYKTSNLSYLISNAPNTPINFNLAEKNGQNALTSHTVGEPWKSKETGWSSGNCMDRIKTADSKQAHFLLPYQIYLDNGFDIKFIKEYVKYLNELPGIDVSISMVNKPAINKDYEQNTYMLHMLSREALVLTINNADEVHYRNYFITIVLRYLWWDRFNKYPKDILELCREGHSFFESTLRTIAKHGSPHSWNIVSDCASFKYEENSKDFDAYMKLVSEYHDRSSRPSFTSLINEI